MKPRLKRSKVKQLAKLGLTHMWNGPDGKAFSRSFPKTDGAVICLAFEFGHMTDGHDDIRNAESPNQFHALESALRQTV